MQDRAARTQRLSLVCHVRGRHNGEEANLSYHTVELFTYSLISTKASMNLKENFTSGLVLIPKLSYRDVLHKISWKE